MRNFIFPRVMDEYSGRISTDSFTLLSPLPVPEPHIGVYTGKGASHSWLWVFDTFEKAKIFTVYPFDEREVEKIEEFNVLFVSGGDTFAVAEGLGDKGAEAIRKFLSRGGVYFGSCAGAYLILHSSKFPLNLFNFIRIPIANIEKELPPVKNMYHKAFNEYGCCFLIHPVRGALLLETTEFPPSFERREIKAPLFGGPIFTEPERAITLARYKGFCERTHFLYDKEVGERIIPGRPAVVGAHCGKGFMFLSGPHLEHPSYPEANLIMFRFIAYALGKFWRGKSSLPEFEADEKMKIPGTIKRLVSDTMKTALRLGDLSVFWKVGEKVYMPEHILAFARALHRRVIKLKGEVWVRGFELNELESSLYTAYNALVCGMSEENAGEVIDALKSSARILLRIYMRTMRRAKDGRIQNTLMD